MKNKNNILSDENIKLKMIQQKIIFNLNSNNQKNNLINNLMEIINNKDIEINN